MTIFTNISAVLGVYLLVGVTGYAVLGDNITPNIVDALQAGWMAYTVNILITIHLLMASVMVTNPVTQGIEGFFGIPDSELVDFKLVLTTKGQLHQQFILKASIGSVSDSEYCWPTETSGIISQAQHQSCLSRAIFVRRNNFCFW